VKISLKILHKTLIKPLIMIGWQQNEARDYLSYCFETVGYQ